MPSPGSTASGEAVIDASFHPLHSYRAGNLTTRKGDHRHGLFGTFWEDCLLHKNVQSHQCPQGHNIKMLGFVYELAWEVMILINCYRLKSTC